MSKPTTSGGGSAPNMGADAALSPSREIDEGRRESTLAATKRTVDADRARVLELLASLQRYVRKGGLDHWEMDGVQAIADLQYAADAVQRFPVGEQLPDAGWRPPARTDDVYPNEIVVAGGLWSALGPRFRPAVVTVNGVATNELYIWPDFMKSRYRITVALDPEKRSDG